MRRHSFRLLTVIAFAALLAACGGGSSSSPPAAPAPTPQYTYTTPNDIGDGWTVASLADEGMDEARVTEMMQRVVEGWFEGIGSVVIVRNNKLVLHEQLPRQLDHFDAWINNTDGWRHILHSTSKSFTSALVGIAIDQGHIASTDVSFYGLFNYGAYDNWDPRKAEMTLEDALTMRFGIEWDEWSLPYTNPANDLVFLETNNFDWSKALLDLPVTSDPGTVFTYNTAGTIAIGQAVENATGIPLADFANEFLFYPMQITTAEWWRSPTGLPVGGSGLFLRTRDMAKFGQLYIDDGVWQGQQLISPEWIAASIAPHVDISSWATYSEAYGYQWWLDSLDYKGELVETWVTSGYGGQYIFCVPSLDLVVAFTGHNYENGPGVVNLYTMMDASILASIN